VTSWGFLTNHAWSTTSTWNCSTPVTSTVATASPTAHPPPDSGRYEST